MLDGPDNREKDGSAAQEVDQDKHLDEETKVD